MPPARKRGSQEQGRHLYNAPRSQARQPGTGATTTSLHGLSLSLWVRLTRRAGMQACRLRQMTTTSLHGSSSFVDLKKRRKKPTPSRNCKRGGGLSLLSWWVQMEADDDDEPTWLVVVRCLKENKEETHPVSQLQARGWVIIVVVVGADGGR